MTVTSTTEKALAEALREQAHWREGKAAQYPEDRRNEQSVAAIRSLADFVETDERASKAVQDLACLVDETWGDAHLGVEPARMVSRYGFGYKVDPGPAQHETFLEELVLACCCEEYEAIGDHDATMELRGLLTDDEVEAARDGVALDSAYWERRSALLPHERAEWIDSYRGAEQD